MSAKASNEAGDFQSLENRTPDPADAAQATYPQLEPDSENSPMHSGPTIEPSGDQGLAGDVAIDLGQESASMAVAHRYMLQTSCTVYDASTDTYKWRSLLKTSREDIGDYGVGFQLYFDFLAKIAMVLFGLGIISLPLLIFAYQGDFAGVSAGFFAKTTIGNIGICGDYGQLCPVVSSYADRLLISGATTLLRTATPAFGGLASLCIALFAIFGMYFYYIHLTKVVRQHDAKHISLDDYSVEVDYLPHRLRIPQDHANYEQLLKAHFEKIVGKENSVAQVSLARDYDGAVRTFLQLSDIEIEMKEALAQSRKATTAKEADSWKAYLKKLEKRQKLAQDHVKNQTMVDENDRGVVKGFITFQETRFRDRVLGAYSWSRQHFIFRLLQVPQLRFQGKPLYVRKASEPGNLYHENLDVSKKNVFFRTVFTIAAAIFVLAVSAVLLTLTQTATRASGPGALGSKHVWIIANASTTADKTCFGTCGISLYPDPSCTGPALVPTGLLDSTGVYSPGTPPVSAQNVSSDQASTCTQSRNWFSNRCTSISGGDPIFNSAKDLGFVNVSTGSNERRLQENASNIQTFENRFSLSFVKAQATVAVGDLESSLQHNAERSDVVNNVRIGLGGLPANSPGCSTNKCANGENGEFEPELNLCYSNAQKCDGIWDCPFGDDEENCAYTCNSSTQWQCPISGKCIDKLTGDCGSECLSSNAQVCIDIAARNVQQLDGVRECDTSAIQSIFANTYSGACPGGFYLSPCCVMSNLSEYDRFDLMCQSDSVTNEVKGSFAIRGNTVLEYMQEYCRSFRRNNGAGQTVCSDVQVSKLVLVSPNCDAAFAHDRRWCECLSDAALLTETNKAYLESCHVDDSNWLYLHSVRNGVQRRMSVMDSIRLGCQQQKFRASTIMDSVVRDSPLITLGLQFVPSVTSSQALVEQIAGLIPNNLAANIVITGGVVGNAAAVRVDINDVSNSTTQGQWYVNVNSAYTTVLAALSGLSGDIRQLSSVEPHCPEGLKFLCPVTRRCIDLDQVCDGVPDCEIPVSGIIATPDEETCTDVESSMPDPVTHECAANQFMCDSKTQCIPDLYWCDGVDDCSDSSDENNSDCEVQFATRRATNSSVAVPQPYLASEYVGFHFADPVTVGCIVIDQPAVSVVDKVSIFACGENVVFRPGVGTVLRYPDLNCIKVQTTAVGSSSSSSVSSTEATAVNSKDLAYSPLTGFPVGCPGVADQCPILEGNPSSFCDKDTSTCQVPRNGTVVDITVLKTPQCDFGSPISPTVAAMIKDSFTDKSSGSVNSDLFDDITYTCFCDQQIQYNSATNMFFMYPPYSSYIQETCAPYYKEELKEKALRWVGIIVVAILNFFLLQLMYFLATFERPYTLTDKAASELWKLFLAQFINTALLVLLVNARFGVDGSGWKVLGFGNGAYDDTTKEWFRNVGAGIALTVLIMVGTIILPTFLIEKVWQHYRRKWARKKLTQDAMNRQLQRGEFLLSARFAQSTNVIVCVVMYFSGIPIMLWIGLTYCIIAYWFDKYFLLRCSKIPPQYSSYTMKICLRLLPIAVIANCCFMIWTFGNQSVFPSDFISEAIATYYNDTFGGEAKMTAYEYGQLGTNNGVTYATYVESRLYESLRKAAFGGLFILGLVVSYFVLFFVFYAIKNTFGAVISVLIQPFQQRKKVRIEAQNRAKSFFGLQVPSDQPTFDEAKKEMKKVRVSSSYKIQDNPRYAPAYEAMNKIRTSIRMEEERRRSIDSPSAKIPSVQLDSSFRPSK